MAKKTVLEYSLELKEFSIKDGKVLYRVACGTGQEMIGTVREETKIPFIKGGYICLAIPISIHVRPGGLAPDFMIAVPGSYGVVTDLKSLR